MQHTVRVGNSAHFFTLLQATKENGMDLQGTSASGERPVRHLSWPL